MIAGKWLLFIAARYFRSRRKDRRFATATLSIVGVWIGITALISILSVMNGFQSGFIENILELTSFHVRIKAPDIAPAAWLEEYLAQSPLVRSFTPLQELQTMIRSRLSDDIVCKIMSISERYPREDERFMRQLNVIEGDFAFHDGNEIMLGESLARKMGVGIGGTVSVIMYLDEDFSLANPTYLDFTVGAVFRCGYLEYDESLAFIDFDVNRRFMGGNATTFYGIKLKNRDNDRRFVDAFVKDGGDTAAVVPWRQYNRAFFSALRMEKIMMAVLLGFVFILVGINLFNGMKRSVLERIEDIGFLRAIGARKNEVRFIFLLEGFLIGTAGSAAGVLSGLAVCIHVNAILGAFEKVINVFVGVANSVAELFSTAAFARVSLFSPSDYYLEKIPARIIGNEVLFIVIWAVLVCLAAAYRASAITEKYRPADVLRLD